MERSEMQEAAWKKYFDGLSYDEVLVHFFDKCNMLMEKDHNEKTWYRIYVDLFSLWKDPESVTVCVNGGSNSTFCEVTKTKIKWSDRAPILDEDGRRRLMSIIMANLYARKL